MDCGAWGYCLRKGLPRVRCAPCQGERHRVKSRESRHRNRETTNAKAKEKYDARIGPRKCAICGSERPRNRGAYCSNKCFVQRRRVFCKVIPCAMCGCDLVQVSTRHKYCSKACSYEAEHGVRPGEPLRFRCAMCACKTPRRSNGQKYCRECAKAVRVECLKKQLMLTDLYIIRTLRRGTGLAREDIPLELIEGKRLHIQLQRLINSEGGKR